MTQNKIEIYFTDKNHVWINGRQYISLGRVGQMLSEKRKTNADKIRDMTDEELANELENLAPSSERFFRFGGETWLDWLKQEADK